MTQPIPTDALVLADEQDPTPTTLPADLAADLAAAGWAYDAATPMDAGAVEDTLLHPAGVSMEITAGGDRHGARLVLDGLTPEQVAAAIRGAGLTGGEGR